MATKVDASHILVKTESEANAIKFDLDHGKKFEDIAMEKSTCPSAKNGGHLGEFSRGQMVKEFEDASFNMNEGDVSEPVQTQFGWHIIKVNHKR